MSVRTASNDQRGSDQFQMMVVRRQDRALDDAIANDRIAIHFQPQIDLESGTVTRTGPDDSKVIIDLSRLQQLGSADAQLLTRYLGYIQVQRGDFNGRMLTVRRDDLRAIACLLDVNPELARAKLDELGLRFTP